MIPNTTPTPNELYNGEMRKMNDTELRVVLVVTRATFGWVMNKKTGMRKTEDWISHSQLITKTGRSKRAISSAIDGCVKKGWIETRDKKGKLLITAKARKLLGKKIYYRLGKIFLDKTMTIANSAMPPSQLKTSTIASKSIKPWKRLPSTKETITKEKLQKKEFSSFNKNTNTDNSIKDYDGSLLKVGGEMKFEPSPYFNALINANYYGWNMDSLAKAFQKVTRFEIWARRITGLVFLLIGIYFTLAYTIGIKG